MQDHLRAGLQHPDCRSSSLDAERATCHQPAAGVGQAEVDPGHGDRRGAAAAQCHASRKASASAPWRARVLLDRDLVDAPWRLEPALRQAHQPASIAWSDGQRAAACRGSGDRPAGRAAPAGMQPRGRVPRARRVAASAHAFRAAQEVGLRGTVDRAAARRPAWSGCRCASSASSASRRAGPNRTGRRRSRGGRVRSRWPAGLAEPAPGAPNRWASISWSSDAGC